MIRRLGAVYFNPPRTPFVPSADCLGLASRTAPVNDTARPWAPPAKKMSIQGRNGTPVNLQE
jgi:hypothetical protein